MAIVRELVTLLRYQVENSGLKSYAQQAQSVGKQVSGVGRAAMQGWREGVRQALNEYGLVPGKVLQGIREQRRLNREQRQSVRNVREIGGGYSMVGSYIRTALAGVGIVAVGRLADEWSGVDARIGLATDSVNDQRVAVERLYASAQGAGQDFLATGDLFTSISRNRKELGLALDDSLQLTDTIGKLLTIGGGSAGSQQAALTQLGQALGSGVLRGDELNSILEQAPRLAQAVADSFGVSIGQLRKLGQEGKLTSKELANGLLKLGESINEEFDRMPKTFGRGMTLVQNAFGRFVNQMNKASRSSERFYAVAQLISENMAAIVKIGAFTALTAALTALRPVAMASLVPFLRMATLLAGIYLIGEDLLVWTQGGQSLFGRLAGDYREWQGTVDGIKEFLVYIKDMLGGANEELGTWAKRWGAVALVAYALLRILSPLRGVIKVIGAELALIAMTPLGRLLSLVGLIVFGLKWCYDNADRIAAKIESAFGTTFDRLKEKLEGMIPDWIKWAMRNATGSGVDALGQENRDSIDRLFKGRAGDLQRPQGYSPSQISQITNETHIHAQTNSPAALANAAGAAVGKATERAVGRNRWVPNVEAMA